MTMAVAFTLESECRYMRHDDFDNVLSYCVPGCTQLIGLIPLFLAIDTHAFRESQLITRMFSPDCRKTRTPAQTTTPSGTLAVEAPVTTPFPSCHLTLLSHPPSLDRPLSFSFPKCTPLMASDTSTPPSPAAEIGMAHTLKATPGCQKGKHLNTEEFHVWLKANGHR